MFKQLVVPLTFRVSLSAPFGPTGAGRDLCHLMAAR